MVAKFGNFGKVHVHVHRPGDDAATVGGTAHDPSSGQFTAGPGATPKAPHEHAAQAQYHKAQHQGHMQRAATLKAAGHEGASEQAMAEARTHASAYGHHQTKAQKGAVRNPNGRHGYNPDSVEHAISASERRGGKVGTRERRAIHGLLRGR